MTRPVFSVSRSCNSGGGGGPEGPVGAPGDSDARVVEVVSSIVVELEVVLDSDGGLTGVVVGDEPDSPAVVGGVEVAILGVVVVIVGGVVVVVGGVIVVVGGVVVVVGEVIVVVEVVVVVAVGTTFPNFKLET